MNKHKRGNGETNSVDEEENYATKVEERTHAEEGAGGGGGGGSKKRPLLLPPPSPSPYLAKAMMPPPKPPKPTIQTWQIREREEKGRRHARNSRVQYYIEKKVNSKEGMEGQSLSRETGRDKTYFQFRIMLSITRCHRVLHPAPNAWKTLSFSFSMCGILFSPIRWWSRTSHQQEDSPPPLSSV